MPEGLGDPWLPTPPQPQGRGAGPVVHEVGPYRSIQVNTDSEGRNIVGDAANEPSIAVDPFAPDRMVIGWRQFDSMGSNFRQGGWGYSRDGGRTWTYPGVLEPGVFRSDPVLDVDAGGNFYYASLALVDPDNQNADVFIDVWKSNDGGQSWSPPVFAFGGDKEWIVVDRTGGEGDGNIYHTFGSVGSPFQPNLFNRSSDGGASFEDPSPINPGVAYGTLVVAPDGTLHIVGAPDDGMGGFEFTYRVATSRDASTSAHPTFEVQDIDMGGTCPFLGFVNPAGGLG